MVTNNKVLTVSYGTFSCTLEGFDNSFDTMKAIAEYFRDLAADDRYFGAEPPTPDAEMLARIAEREIERRVSARTEAGAIYLSARDEQPPQDPAPVPADTAQENTVPEPAAEAAFDEAAGTAPVAAQEDQAETPTAEPETAEAPEVEEIEVEDVTDDILRAVNAAPDAPEDDPESETAEASPEQVEETAEALEEDGTPDLAETGAHTEEAAFAEAELVEPEDAFEPEDDSIAAKLQRIRAVVSKSAQEPEEDDFSEDEHAESFLAGTRREIESVLTLDDEMAAAATQDDAEDADEENAGAGDAAPMVRARVLRMKKSDLDAAVSDGLLEAEPDEDETAEIEDAPATGAEAQETPSSLSPEDEAELLAELAQVEAELNRGDAAAVAPKRPKALSDAGSDMSRLLRETNSHMDEPEGNRRRQAIAHLRAAVAATKAEQKANDGKPETDETEAYREDLASVVGRPAGPAPDAPRPAPLKLVAEQRIDAPEKARDDTPGAADAPRAPVRPRRVSSVDRQTATAAPRRESAADDASSFAEYAESLGATRLPDVLEAAAAYLTYVEGHEKFSRPQVIRMVRDVDEENCSREDTLRTFGQLLREKKIEKISGGRFTVSENIAYKPEDRAAG